MITKPLMTFESPAKGSLLFSSMRGTAELGRPYQYEVTLLSRNPSIDLRMLIGKKVAVELGLPTGGRRRFEGYVTRFTQTGMRGRYHTYQASLRPWMSLMKRRSNSRIFHGTLRDIVKAMTYDPVYSKIDFGAGEHWLIDYRTMVDREFCVQYRESDFNFISRLMEDEGVHYWFWDHEGKEKLLFANSLSAHEAVPGYETLPYARLQDDAEVIHAWRPEVNLRTSTVRLVDYDFTNPPPFEVNTDFRMPLDTLAIDTAVVNEDFPDLELFDYPGGFTNLDEGSIYATARRDEATADWFHMVGETNARGLAVGGKFTMERHPRDEFNGEYVVTRAEYELDFADYEGLDDSAQRTRFSCRFGALPILSGYAPARRTPRPRVQGPQTAIVVGPEGDEIHTDEYGRVKVHFMWDRLSKHNQDSSCYVRVSQPWAGNQWGMIALPRIGQEVIVDFLEGDPDHPIIIGRVYNAANMPPYDLPANKTQTGIKTRSTPDGTPDNFNEIRFEDSRGQEQVYIHAERNMDTKVEADSSLSVDANRTVTVGKDRKTTIKGDLDELYIKGQHKVEVDKGEDYTVHEGGQVIRVNKGGQYLGSLAGKQEFYTDTEQQTTVLGSGQKTYVEGGQKTMVKKGDATLFVDGSNREVAADNVTHVATVGDVTSVASGTFFAQGAEVKVKSTGDILMACDGDFKIINGGNFSVTNSSAASETRLGSWSDLALSLSNSTKLALSNETSLALTNSTFIGLKFETDASVAFGIKLGPDFGQSLIKVDQNGLSMEMMTMKMINGGAPGGGAASASVSPSTFWSVVNAMGTGVAAAAGRANVLGLGAALIGGFRDGADGKNAYQTGWEEAKNSVAEGFFPDIHTPPEPPPDDANVPARDPAEMAREMRESVSDAAPPADGARSDPGAQQ